MRMIPSLPVEVRKIVALEGKLSVSFYGMNSWYEVPAHLEAVIRRAANEGRAVAISTTTNAVVTAKLSRRRKCVGYSGPSLDDYKALGGKKRSRGSDRGL